MSLWRTGKVILTGVRVVRVTVPGGIRLVRAVLKYRRGPSRETRAAVVHEGASLIHAAWRAARHMKPKPKG